MKTFITFIVVNLNNLIGLKKTLKSLIELQKKSKKKISILVIDGDSSDGSKEFLHKTKKKIIFISEKDRGIYHAMNKGIIKSKSLYLSFMNSGDYPIIDNYLRFINFLDSENSYFADNIWYPKKNTGFKFLKFQPILLRMPNHQAMIFHERDIAKFRYNESYKFAADLDLKLYCYKRKRLKKHDDFVVYTETGGYSQTIKNASELINRALENAKIAKKYFGIFIAILNFIIFIFWHYKNIAK